MRYNREELERWVERFPQFEKFMRNFFDSCRDDPVTAYVNYCADIESYSRTHIKFRKNKNKLDWAFIDISGLEFNRG